MMEDNQEFGWSNTYRAFLFVAFLIPFVDIFIQLMLKNWAWMIVSIVFSVVLLGMLLLSFKRPFIKLANGELEFYLLPMPPIVFQRIKLSEIESFSVEKSKLVINLIDGTTASANLYAVKAADRERMLEYLIGTNHQLS
jgi:ABC-type multidrug transport system permease subunit